MPAGDVITIDPPVTRPTAAGKVDADVGSTNNVNVALMRKLPTALSVSVMFLIVIAVVPPGNDTVSASADCTATAKPIVASSATTSILMLRAISMADLLYWMVLVLLARRARAAARL